MDDLEIEELIHARRDLAKKVAQLEDECEEWLTTYKDAWQRERDARKALCERLQELIEKWERKDTIGSARYIRAKDAVADLNKALE